MANLKLLDAGSQLNRWAGELKGFTRAWETRTGGGTQVQVPLSLLEDWAGTMERLAEIVLTEAMSDQD